MSIKRYILLLWIACVSAYVCAQTDTIRYVHPNGSYGNLGRSWASAKNRVQDAINDLRDYMAENGLHSGSVYIAAGTYVPTESTESSGGSMLNTSFKIYEGIHVYGGFNPDAPEEKPGDRIMSNGKKCSENWADPSGIGTTSGKEIASQWDLMHKTILTGNHSSTVVTFTFDSIRGRYNTAYPASSYHVVWFATNGKYTTTDDELKDHYRPLQYPASLDGCVISSGNASGRSTTTREHIAYGGGVYMVGNSSLRNCIVERCNATMRGGGIYADGGGVIEFCFVHTCQSIGVGVVEGYGGGVCIDQAGSVGHSHITSCAARCGGGLLICHANDEYPWTERLADPVLSPDTLTSYYSPFATACVINNNTANAEGGGIYLAEGGTVNHCTVTANNCSSADVTYYGRRHGRTGGIYVRNCGLIFNSVFWGNRCDANSDIQFASVRQSGTKETHEIFAYHTAFMNHDITDWTGVKKEKVFSLDRQNMPAKGSSANYPCFFNPTVDPNDWNKFDTIGTNNIHGAGVFMHLKRLTEIPGPRIWHLTSYSALDQKGVQWSEAVQDVNPWLIHAHTDYGVVTNPYEPVSTLGALVRKPDPMQYALVIPQGQEGRESSTPIPTLFVDPNRQGVYDSEGNFMEPEHEGDCWDEPIKEFGEAISYFRQYLITDPGEQHHYRLPNYNPDHTPTGDSTNYPYVQILMKEGTVTTVGPGNYLDRNIRSAAIRIGSHMRLYGGYPSSLTGTDTKGRNPRNHKSFITANITGVENATAYQNNSAHVIVMVNCEHSIVDGFTMNDANTHNVYLSNSASAGGGLLLNNASVSPEERINMMGNQLRNCVITNCTSPKGAAVYVNGEWPKADGEICYAELFIANCVIRNNTADFTIDGGDVNNHGIITANGRAYVHTEHCTVVNNVGFPFKSESKKTDVDEPIVCPHPEHEGEDEIYRGYVRVDNTLVFCNSDRTVLDNTTLGEVANVLSVNGDGQDYVFGKYNMFDADLKLHKADLSQPHGFFQDGYTVPITEHFLPDGVISHFTDDISDIPTDSAERANKSIFTRIDMTAPTFPVFLNPARNVGHSTSGDKPLYGGVVAYVPMSTNPCVNAAGRDEYTDYYDYDRSDVIKRDHGGAPDVGAVENSDLPPAGTVIYVTTTGAGKMDGSSWGNAIAGNAVYRLYGAPAAEGDSIDAANGARLINLASDSSVTTEDQRYCKGYATKYIYPVFTDRGRNIARNLEIDKYIGGNNPRIDTTHNDTTSNTLMTAYKYNNGTIPSSYVSTLAPDPKYPYGEMSGASRYTYRAANNYSPLKEDASNVMLDGSVPASAEEVVASGRLVLRNERTENYVSGLQYAVEKASQTNKSLHKDTVQVWVGAGKYTDYKGYVMRDSVSVYGGFPVKKYTSPGMAERQALMSAVVTIPQADTSYNPVDYETILQISDVNPKKSNTEINPSAIKFTDDSATVKVNILYNISNLTDHNTVHYYRWQPGTDVSSDYMRYPNMLYSETKNVFSVENPSCRHKTDKIGVSSEGGWSWVASEKYVYQYWGDKGGGNNSWELVYANRTNNVDYNCFLFDDARTVINAEGNEIGKVSHGMELSGGMSKMSVWQTMKNVPAGDYQLEIDLAAFYRQTGDGHGYDVDDENTGVTFYIVASDGTTVAEQPVFVKNTTAPYRLRRYSFQFTQPASGNLTVLLMSAPGTKATDPEELNSPLPAMNENLNRREVMMANVHLYVLDGDEKYILDRTEEEDVVSRIINSTSISEEYESGTKRNRSVLRKRVLQMPDVTATTYIHSLGYPTTNNGGKYADNLQHYERLIKTGRLSNVKTTGGTVNGRHQDPNYKEYNKVYWDGFTIRHGFVYNQRMAHGGGAGVCMYEGAHLVNCIVTDNWAGAGGVKGGGVFCDGSTSTIENCFILNNTSTQGTGVSNNTTGQQQAGGLFMYEGTCFNTLIANNHANGPGGALGLCVAKFYNNTLAYNSSNNGVGGVRVATGSEPAIFMANCIIFGNTGKALSITSGSAAVAPFINCYIQSATQLTTNSEGNFLKALADHTEGVTDGNYGRNNTFLNKVNPSAANTPFAADVVNGNYTSGAKTSNNFALRQVPEIKCINSGEEDFEGAMYEAVRTYLRRNNAALNPTDANIRKETFYKNVVGVKLPDNDVVYAKRIQDCQVDIGAYEFNAAFGIKPDTTTHPGHAVFYVSFMAEGDASSSTPHDAACMQKLQLVLDAAGRYKHNLMTSGMYNKGYTTTEAGKDSIHAYVSKKPNKYWTVEVWLEGDSVGSTVSNEYHDKYTATRSTRHSEGTYQDNTLDYSFIVPHGVHVRGGYTKSFFHFEDAAGNILADTTEQTYHVVVERDPLTFRTVLSGHITSSTGATGQTYHVVSFTNDLFRPDNEKKIGDGNQLAVMTDERDRAVLDGLFIMDGNANAPDDVDKVGAGCVVTDFAHVRNCVVQNNNAIAKGGGLFLKPNALVSGTIVKNNTAEVGGGIYFEPPADELSDKEKNASLAHVFSSTICENTARASAGGVFFENAYARVNSSAMWHNSANDNANVSGNFTRTDDTTSYPLNFCAVESRRLEGQGNIELSPRETEGVRWDRQDPFNAILYYPIEMSSTLSRAGMNYPEWDKACAHFTTLDTIDIAGVSRKRWISDGSGRNRGFAWKTDTLVTKNNDLIDIGARAVNKNFAVDVDERYVMHRLYVMHTDLIDSKAARALQDNPLTDNDTANMYRQMGSCILNPFHRLDDAFDYVIEARMKNPDRYRNVRFEIFVEQGTYYPVHDAYRRQGEVRMNTFLIPEAVLIVGGVDSRPANHKYGQDGFISPYGGDGYVSLGTGEDIPIPGTEYTINYETTDNIRLRDPDHRPMRDNNLNSVIEPWELERQTILSGNAVSGEDFTHIYHVVTCHADDRYVGPRPLKFRTRDSAYAETPGSHILTDPIGDYDGDHWHEENDLSILGRTIGFDGLQITGGYANHIDPQDTAEIYNQKTYFRGGGIFVDGTWSRYSGGTAPSVTEPAKYDIPIVVENCFFTNNMAGNGGAIYSNGGIYMFGCHMTQNYSEGPMTELDQRYIPWTAGGCVATNAACNISNSLFANNEARRGLYPLIAASDDSIPYADARQGFGGVLSVAHHSRLRVVNCQFTKNKAVAYSSVYNFLANNRYSDSDSMQYVFNSIFWGNEVFDVDSLSGLDHVVAPPAESEKAFAEKYKASRAGVFHYDGDEWDTYERLFHQYDSLYKVHEAADSVFHPDVIAKLNELRAQGNKMEGMYFCAYRKGYGPTGMKPTQDGYLLTGDEYRSYLDPRRRNTRLIVDPNGDTVEDYTNLWSQVSGNNNTIINPINTATDGPNFKQPSFVAGIDGYMQNADWLQARMNLTTDQGWGYLAQKVERGISYYITKYTGTDQFDTEEQAWNAIKDIPGADREADIYAIKGMPVATFKPKAEQPVPGAMYNFLSLRYGTYMSRTNPPLPTGDDYYMSYTRSTSDSETSGAMNRISKNPKLGVKDVFIDLGIYEYQYVQLDIKGQEIDTMWVATKTKDPILHDGLSWETPTTDLQTAIDMLLSSHNNHDKYICLMGDDEGGTFSPANVIDNRRAFIISSNSLSPLLPDSAEANTDYGVNSLTFLGGYSFDVKGEKRDPQAHPVVIEMPHTGAENQLNQLFVIEDMTRQMLQANFIGEYTSRDSVVIPIVFDGMTFINPYSIKDPAPEGLHNIGGQMSKKGGAAIYYRWQRRYDGDGTNFTPNFKMALHPDSALIDGVKVTLPKLTISNCIFMDNGSRNTTKHAERSPAVRIDHGGGSSLIVNSLFHSNAGAPVYARTYDVVEGENDLASVPNNVIIVNSTFALNDGHLRLESDNSEVHNSLIWLDDLDNDTLVQLQMGADQWDRTVNRERPGIKDRMTNNAVWGCFMQAAKDTLGNDSLVTDNSDIYGGPGFVQPFVTATTSEQRRERSFRLNPSTQTIGKADTTVYRSRVFFRQYPVEAGEANYWRRSNGFKSSTITALANDSDLAAKPRLSGKGMERGAYECLAVLQRVLYVQPSLAAFSAGDGSSWAHPFGQGQLQNAIDAASVYTYLNQADPERENRKAYVFVKGSYDTNEHTHVMARDGVFVYGGLPGNFNDTAAVDEESHQFTNGECQRFVNYVRAYHTGTASPNATPTRINAVHAEGDAFHTGFLLDGFVITNPNTTLTTSPVILDNEMVALRNCLITDNKVNGEPVADIRKGLLYNNLFYANTADAVVRVAADGLALNNTIVTTSESVTTIDSTLATTGAIQNNIALNTALSPIRCFAPYLTQNALAYQLHERSAYIHAGTADDALPTPFDTFTADKTIDFAHDRDILGNPRKIGSTVDVGALETWRVDKNNGQEITALTNRVHPSWSDELKREAYLNNYGGNKYPHPGSVVYLMDSSAMTMQYEAANDFKDFKNNPIILRPGFVLLKPAASFYGNGHDVQFNYLAVEKRFVNQRYSMTAFPFNYSVDNISSTSYDGTIDSLTLHSTPIAFNTYQYSGAARSAKDYTVLADNSSLWMPVDTLNRTATEGYLMDFGTPLVDTVLRFTAQAPTGRYVYTENGELDKIVRLTQYDNRQAGSGADLNFTSQENMGWNMKGLPWLVSNYRTDTILEEDNYQRQMFIPHLLYQMDGAGNYLTEGDKIYSAQSWKPGTSVSMGSAFFTQTATTKDYESVYFHLPYYSKNEKVSRPLLRMVGKTQKGQTSDIVTLMPDEEASRVVNYTYGRDGLKWGATEDESQIYLLDSKRLSRISLLGAAPVEVDIPLGVVVPEKAEYTFSLPDKEAFADYTYVWLIDYTKNRYTNLLEEDYTPELEAGETNTRFAVRIGGFPKTDENGKQQYVVYSYEGMLFVRGLVEGDRIAVYAPSGQLICTAVANTSEWSMPLTLPSGYVVSVNKTSYKVLDK